MKSNEEKALNLHWGVIRGFISAHSNTAVVDESVKAIDFFLREMVINEKKLDGKIQHEPITTNKSRYPP